MKKMRLYRLLLIIFVVSISLTNWNCVKKENKINKNKESFSLSFDSAQVETFYSKYPKLAVYKKQVVLLYQKNRYDYIWFDKNGRRETADVFYNKINNLFEDGVIGKVPYNETFESLFQKGSDVPDVEFDLFLSNYYFYYANKVLRGIDKSKTNELGWYLPRKKLSYVTYLDSLLIDPKFIDKKNQHIEQYYKLKAVLKRYRAIEQKGGWDSIALPTGFVSIKPGDSSDVVSKIRTRLFLTGDIDVDSGGKFYEPSLQKAVLKYKKRNGFILNKTILPKHVDEMNVPISSRIRTIIVNMERCRWISTDVTKAKEFIAVNIPSYRLTYFKKGKAVLTSNVVVGNMMNKTVIFSGMMSYIVFSPYWNVPKSIVEKEILPGIEKDGNYLAKHNMEWEGENIRQKPGKDNSLGLIKFLFPNNNNIYLHDSPAKELFNAEKRAFSHGCIRVEKPKELANLILEDDSNWTPEKIDEAMNKGEESWYTLKNKIPVYIGYFTAWVDDEGNINFYKDIYERDKRLTAMLVEE
ncbi:L,D-transpeptidase family protein [Flavobacterium sp.]|uniref:L,D-transpeptidase family protein n=1 Tax=Flavobacterium sp. TaxID=239 RepID=UPI0025EAF384|nr:L,D-transpeptidase family protein [Flavobacterium sp.]